MQSTISRPDTVEDATGASRRIVEVGDADVVVVGSDGARLRVPLSLIERRPDRWRLTSSWAELTRSGTDVHEEVRVPVVEETVHVDTRTVERGHVRIHKSVHEEQQSIDVPLMHESVHVERVPVNQYVTEAPEIRQEGDVTVVPCVEEVVVVEKRLLLREELRVTRSRETRHHAEQVTVRREEVEVERFDDPTPQHPSNTDKKKR